jgi:hypothetical protein
MAAEQACGPQRNAAGRRWAGLTRALSILFVLLAAGPAPAAGRYEGVASCAGSTCHGRAEGDGKVVRQDELRIWQEPSARSGAHSRAFAALASARGQRIARTLGLGNAETARACLGCHVTTTSPSGTRFQPSDGVGCESCHGPSSGWIASHYAVGASHAANLAAGMVALDQPGTRASVCLDCHYGSAKPGQFVTHSMMAAGHPRLAFELDLFSSLQQHWDEDGDYAARKGRTDSVRLWATGQAQAVKRALALFARNDLATDGIFPQFTFYDCHSCHRPIDDNPARERTFEVNPGRPIPFGQPPFNDENMILLSAVGQALVPAEAARFDAASRDFHAAMGKSRADAVAAAGRLGAAAEVLSGAIGGGGGDTAFRVVAAIGGKAVSPRFTDYAGSAQAVMAVETLLNAMVR